MWFKNFKHGLENNPGNYPGYYRELAQTRRPRSEVGDGASKRNSKSLQDEVYVDVDVRRVSDVDVDGSVFGLFLQENVSQFR